MATVVTTNGSFSCTENGTATVTTASNTFQVDGYDVVLASDIIGSTITGCTNSTKPCLTVLSYVSGASTILQKGGTFVILSGAVFLTDGAIPAFTATDSHTKLTSN